jgi:hypothetical protein
MLWDSRNQIYDLMEIEHLKHLKNQLSINGYCFDAFLHENGLSKNYKSIKKQFLINKNLDIKRLDFHFKKFIKEAKKKIVNIKK